VDTVAYIAIAGALIVLAVGGWIIADKLRKLETQIKALWPLEQEVADQNEVIAAQGRDIRKLRVEKAAQDTIIAEQRKGIEKLQSTVARLETEVATWKRNFTAVCKYVRENLPDDKKFNNFLAGLDLT
jgi:predicted RNase H-like nuclease (RuvC/YqgF family)